MTAARRDLADLPYWPRWMSRDQAASYVGVSPNLFDAEVEAGVWPKPERRGTHKSRKPRLTWDRKLLDRTSDARSGLIAADGDAGSGIGDLEW